MRRGNLERRVGSVLPFMAFLLIIIMIFIALAIDIGLMVLARNHAQIAADAGALAGVRQLDGKSSKAANFTEADTYAKDAAKANLILSKNADTVTVNVGTYNYIAADKKFKHEPNPTTGADDPYSAVQVRVQSNQPSYFSRIIGFTDYDVQAIATSVHRPRDIAMIMDFSGSMRFSSLNSRSGSNYASGTNSVNGSANPEISGAGNPTIPNFGPWSSYQGDGGRLWRTTSFSGGGYTYAPGNWTMNSPDSGDAIIKDFQFDPAGTAGSAPTTSAMLNAFHNSAAWTKSGLPATPAPATAAFRNQTDAVYTANGGDGGDIWPARNSGATIATAALGATPSYARTVRAFLYGSNAVFANNHARDAAFEASGYDIVAGNTFKGYSMGPGYYGKTFFMWPPDPRPANDWRKKFFHYPGNTANRMDDNAALFSVGAGTNPAQYMNTPGTGYDIDYAAILTWIKQEPRTLPPNLRAGRVLYYTHIPDDVVGAGGGDEISRDKLFWRNYIEHVIGSRADSRFHMYGTTNEAFGATGNVRITAKSNVQGADGVAGGAGAADDPYMHYSDCPRSPLLHFWFGPMSMLDFIGTYNRSWMPGNCHEAQTWQLKAGVNSALTDIEKNHPNDWVSLIYFSGYNHYNTARVPLGKDYRRMKNALFFPYNLLDSLQPDPPPVSVEWRPYDDAFANQARGQLPNADGSTCPEMGLKVAYNQFSGATGFNGRRGASKVVILETDGVPNFSCASAAFVDNGAYLSTITSLSGYDDSDTTDASRAVNAAAQICALDTNPALRGYSSSTNKARVHCLAFGDLFENLSNPDAIRALEFLYDVQIVGNTSDPLQSPVAGTYIQDYKVINGSYTQRIDRLKIALRNIMQSGVQVTLIKGEGEYP